MRENKLVEPLYERERDGAPGAFYVVKDQCLLCALPAETAAAIMQLAIMRRMGLLTDSELSVFSAETQQIVRGVDSLRNAEPDSTPNDGSATAPGDARADQ